MARSILVVSSAQAFRQSLKQTLQRRGYHVTVADSAAKAVQHQDAIDMAVLDLEHLSRREAETLQQQLRAGNATQEVVFLINGRSRTTVPPSLRWASQLGPVVHKSRQPELLHIVKMACRGSTTQIRMPARVTQRLRVEEPIRQWPQLHELKPREMPKEAAGDTVRSKAAGSRH